MINVRQTFRAAALITAGVFASAAAQAGPVDLSGWVAEGGGSSWNVESGNNSVLQTVNGAPTIFFDPTASSSQGTALNGKIRVVTSEDDDYIGFVLGYQSGDLGSASTDFFLVDWKQGNQAGGGNYGFGSRGLAISHVTNASDDFAFWGHDSATGSSVVTEIARGNTLFDTGWNDNQEYAFNIIFNSGVIEVQVDGVTELAITPGDVSGISSFSDGAFGFYNFSQAQVRYSAIEQANCTNSPNLPECQTSVPEAPSIAFLLVSLFGAGVVRVIRKA